MKRETIQIPRDITSAVKELTAIEELLTAKQWARAAIVATFVEPRAGQGRQLLPKSKEVAESGLAFAQRGIKGLTSPSTVLLYANAWLERFPRPKPGQKVTLPSDEWPPMRTGTDGYESETGMERTLDRMIAKHGAQAVANAIIKDPVVETAISRAQIDRYSPAEEREGLIERGQAREAALGRAIGESHAGLAEHTDHPAEIELEAARMRLRLAVRAMRQFPYMSDGQRSRLEEMRGECEILVQLLRGAEWSDDDRKFLDELGLV